MEYYFQRLNVEHKFHEISFPREVRLHLGWHDPKALLDRPDLLSSEVEQTASDLREWMRDRSVKAWALYSDEPGVVEALKTRLDLDLIPEAPLDLAGTSYDRVLVYRSPALLQVRVVRQLRTGRNLLTFWILTRCSSGDCASREHGEAPRPPELALCRRRAGRVGRRFLLHGAHHMGKATGRPGPGVVCPDLVTRPLFCRLRGARTVRRLPAEAWGIPSSCGMPRAANCCGP